jgi:anthranilate/para-aminobenzoate synthase component I
VHPFDPGPLAPATPRLDAAAPFEGLRSTFTREGYEEAVRRALAYIRAGDVYQVNLSQRFETACDRDPFDVYLDLRGRSPAPFGAFLSYPDFAVLSASPERFLRYDPRTRTIETRPIKGTRPRGSDSESDRALAEELVSSEKDRAENVMIVDLERNDLGKVAVVGSVEVSALWELETFSTVHHLTSTVRARLRADRSVVELLRAAFPGGSITGAPKIRAMEIIDELEPVARGVYTGAIGHIGFDGSSSPTRTRRWSTRRRSTKERRWRGCWWALCRRADGRGGRDVGVPRWRLRARGGGEGCRRRWGRPVRPGLVRDVSGAAWRCVSA